MRKFPSPFGTRMGLKVRKSKAPPPPKGCPMGACMALLGGAWTTNLVWQLSGGPRRFRELARDIPGLSPKMLSARLRELARKGALARPVAPTSPPPVEYPPPHLGHQLLPVLDPTPRAAA